MIRVAFGSGAQLATYDLSMRVVQRLPFTVPEGPLKVALSATVSAVFVSVMMNPMDVISTRMYNSPGIYSSVWSCISKTVKNEGIWAFYKGMSAQYGESQVGFVFFFSNFSRMAHSSNHSAHHVDVCVLGITEGEIQ